jgi:hypothetical protein
MALSDIGARDPARFSQPKTYEARGENALI